MVTVFLALQPKASFYCGGVVGGKPLTRGTVDVSLEREDFLREESHGKIVRRLRITERWMDWQIDSRNSNLGGGYDMLKKLAKKLFGEPPSAPSSEGFFLNVRCNSCGEVFNLFINKSTDLAQNFDERGGVTYSLSKEIIGSRCRNLIYVKMEFDGGKTLVSRDIENGEFIEE